MLTLSSPPSQARSPATERTALASRPNLPVEAMTIWGRPGKCIKTERSPVVYCIVHRIGLHKSMQPTIKNFLLYNSNCEKNIRILIHRIWALTQWQKNGTAILPSNRAKWQPVFSESYCHSGWRNRRPGKAGPWQSLDLWVITVLNAYKPRKLYSVSIIL